MERKTGKAIRRNRVYFVQFDADYGGIFICAKNLKQAKSIAWEHDIADGYDWIHMEIKWIKTASSKGLKLGVINMNEVKNRGFGITV